MKKKRVFNIIAIVSIVIFAFSITPITLQNDTYYTVAIGKHILENGIDMKDPFSWHENLPYTYPHWAYDTATYLVYNLGENVGIGGFTAIYIATVMLSMVLGLVVYLVNSKLSKNNVISFIVTLGVLYLLKDYIAARAQLVTFILFALTILFIEDYIETHKKIYLFGLLAISILMVNIHVAVWPFYFVLFLPYIAEAIICWISDNDIYNRIQVWTYKNKIKRLNRKGKKEQAEKVAEELKHIQENHLVVLEGQKKRRNNPYKVKITKEIPIKGLIIIMIISIFTGLLTPLGTTPYTYLIKTMKGNTTHNISEHLPLTLANNIPIMTLLIMFIIILMFTDTKIKLRDLFMLSGLTLLAFMTRRQTSLLALIGSFIFSKLVSSLFEKYAPEAKEKFINMICTLPGKVITLLLIIIMSLHMYSGKIGNKIVSRTKYPVEAADWMLQNLDVKNIKLFNEYNYGSYLLYKGIPVFIDSRADLYAPEFNGSMQEDGKFEGRDIFTDFMEISGLNEYYEDTFEKYGITHVILKKTSKLYKYISRDDSYLEIYSDKSFVIYERCKIEMKE